MIRFCIIWIAIFVLSFQKSEAKILTYKRPSPFIVYSVSKSFKFPDPPVINRISVFNNQELYANINQSLIKIDGDPTHQLFKTSLAFRYT